jgi:hypothetical protein
LPVSDPNEALSLVMSPAMDPESTAVIEQNDETPGPFCPTGGAPQQAALVQPEIFSGAPDQLDVRLETKSSGWLVLSDVWYPGWQVFLDGKVVPIARANYLFRAVAVPAGDHRVSFVYRPGSFYLGALISLAAWGGFLLYQVQFHRAPVRIKRLDWVSS